MKNISILLVLIIVSLKAEELRIYCSHKPEKVKLEINYKYIKLPRGKDIDYSKYQSKNIEEKDKLENIPLAKTYPLEENKTIIENIFELIGVQK